jgi:2-succinyl-5-enolpyruvyl-6-hydroxy-3-cyclohexene-1-carboxylate synthase
METGRHAPLFRKHTCMKSDNHPWAPNDWAAITWVKVLLQCGLKRVVISPGSRSTPLVYALAMEPEIQTFPVLDERSAAFFALGMAKSTREPVMLLCTSGTASANYLPAIAEARYSHAPLIVVTADRPPEMQEVHAGQTILQTGIFASFAQHAVELAVPESSTSYARYLRATLRHAWFRASHPQPGVVHLNVPFRDPLHPQWTDASRNLADAALAELLKDEALPACPVSCTSGMSDGSIPKSELPLVTSLRGLIVAGPSYLEATVPAWKDLLDIASARRIPVVADALNPLRNQDAEGITVCRHYEWYLNAPALRERLKPDWVLQLGDLPTGKNLRHALEYWDVPLIPVGAGMDNIDPLHCHVLLRLPDLESACSWLERSPLPQCPIPLYEDWIRLDERCRSWVANHMRTHVSWVEPALCHHLASMLPDPCRLFAGNSMIIRDLENYWRGTASVTQVLSNRGANGIDGLVSTSIGAAMQGAPVFCLVGDLSFLHDCGALMLKQQLPPSQRLIILLIDNHGGGIFEHLPISKMDPPFEDYFATPQQVDFRAFCAAFGIVYQEAQTLENLKSCIDQALKPRAGNIGCIHLVFDRKRSAAWRRELTGSLLSHIENP